MKAIILAGGLGTRISEESHLKPKPMIEIGGKPILWHIMKTYNHYGIHDFIICAGYKANYIKQYFKEYYLQNCDITVNVKKNEIEYFNYSAEEWKVTIVDTGLETMTGGRLKRVAHLLGDEPFCMTYGDGLCDINIANLVNFHLSHGSLATMTAVQPAARFGAISVVNEKVTSFEEKPKGDGQWINGGYFVLDPKVIDYIDNDQTIWEHEPLKQLAGDGELTPYMHNQFWSPMDTLRDKNYLEELWDSGAAPWKVWS